MVTGVEQIRVAWPSQNHLSISIMSKKVDGNWKYRSIQYCERNVSGAFLQLVGLSKTEAGLITERISGSEIPA